MNINDRLQDVTRRDFFKGGSMAALMTMLGGVELKAQSAPGSEPEKPEAKFKIKVGVIGMGLWGRFLVTNLSRMPEAEIAAVCDTYPAFLRRGAKLAPGAEAVEDYKAILANKDIKAVIVATPTHLHREIVLEALKANKHVYCEAPLATSVEDARAIAKAAAGATRSYFQSGLQFRSDLQRQFLMPFIRSGAMGEQVTARAHFHKKMSWRTASPNPEREKELNWRLSSGTSPGVIGELGIHQVDAMTWFLNKRPTALTGFGSLVLWKDGRDVEDSIQTVFEFPDGVHGHYEATLANSFDSDLELYHGSSATVLVRGTKAWMFKEADAPMLGWEVYARKDTFYKETGIALIANATKLDTVTKRALDEEAFEESPVYSSLAAFLYNSHITSTGIDDFVSSFGENDAEMKTYLKDLDKNRLPFATAKDGFEATVLVLKANEAIRKRSRLVIQDAWFEV